MRAVPEFFPKKQAKPERVNTTEMESRQSSLYSSYNALWSEYMEVKDVLDKLLNEQIQQIEKLLIETRQIKLHLASMSGESLEIKDGQEEQI